MSSILFVSAPYHCGVVEVAIRRTLALAEHYDPDFAHFLAITPWPYAEIYEEMMRRSVR